MRCQFIKDHYIYTNHYIDHYIYTPKPLIGIYHKQKNLEETNADI